MIEKHRVRLINSSDTALNRISARHASPFIGSAHGIDYLRRYLARRIRWRCVVTNPSQVKSTMQKLMRFAIVIVLLLFVVTPLVIYNRLASKDLRYSQTITKYECVQDNCAADFDADGRTGNLLIDRTSSPPSGSYSARQDG
jgi:hypothetical protein